MKRHPRKRATAKSRASKRQPLAALRNPKPHIPAPTDRYYESEGVQVLPGERMPDPWATDWDDEPMGDVRPEIPGFWTRLWRWLS